VCSSCSHCLLLVSVPRRSSRRGGVASARKAIGCFSLINELCHFPFPFPFPWFAIDMAMDNCYNDFMMNTQHAHYCVSNYGLDYSCGYTRSCGYVQVTQRVFIKERGAVVTTAGNKDKETSKELVDKEDLAELRETQRKVNRKQTRSKIKRDIRAKFMRKMKKEFDAEFLRQCELAGV
jgi:hypothetical protein